MTPPDFQFQIHDDWISCGLADPHSPQILSHHLAKYNFWQEVVTGIDSVAVQFDPAILSPDNAFKKLRDQLNDSLSAAPILAPAITIPICYNAEFAPDLRRVAEGLSLSIDEIATWHSSLKFKVAMLGFMPGFAYLECRDHIPEWGRLPQPRQHVEAGSIGIIGSQSCIYSFDSPGGWPIIGRTPLSLFGPDRVQPSLLQPGQQVTFDPISPDTFVLMQQNPSA